MYDCIFIISRAAPASDSLSLSPFLFTRFSTPAGCAWVRTPSQTDGACLLLATPPASRLRGASRSPRFCTSTWNLKLGNWFLLACYLPPPSRPYDVHDAIPVGILDFWKTLRKLGSLYRYLRNFYHSSPRTLTALRGCMPEKIIQKKMKKKRIFKKKKKKKNVYTALISFYFFFSFFFPILLRRLRETKKIRESEGRRFSFFFFLFG